MTGRDKRESNGARVIVFAPADGEEAARVLVRCTELAAEGRAVRVGILESPYRPGARFGVDCVSFRDRGGGRLVMEQHGRGDEGLMVERHAHGGDGQSTVGRNGQDGEGQLTVEHPVREGGVGGAHITQTEIPVHGTASEVIGSIESAGRGGAARVLLTHRRMERIHEISKADMLAVVDGGVSWNELRSAVSGTGLYLPYETGALVDGATVAEVVMGGPGASTDGRFGGLREHVLSIEMVTAGGELIHTGSRSVKDVGGYDVAGFVVGDGGLCGMVMRVTLRLVPVPGSRVVFEARGAYPVLRELARHVHHRMRPAFLEIYEGLAAELLDGGVEVRGDGWGGESHREAPPRVTDDKGSRNALIRDELQGSGRGTAAYRIDRRAILIGELQAPGPGREKRLLEEAAAGFDNGPPLVMCAPELVHNRRRFFDLAFSALDRGRGVVHCSLEPEMEKPGAPEKILYRSLYPERLHTFTASDEIDLTGAAGCDDPSIRPRTPLDVLASFGAKSDPGLGSEITLLYRCNDTRRYRRIHRDEFDHPLPEVFRGMNVARSSEHRDAYDVLWGRVREVFDPQGIMLP